MKASVPDAHAVPALASDSSDSESDSGLDDKIGETVAVQVSGPTATLEAQQTAPLVDETTGPPQLLESLSSSANGPLDSSNHLPLFHGAYDEITSDALLTGIGAQLLNSSSGLCATQPPYADLAKE